ncbi:MAG: sterol desaturase family protein [Cyclobacteriaceae bacterium]|nr:sterol desaturase family protein [Cyclobacteriaceae bacterium]
MWLTIFACAVITIGTFLFWEFVAWFTHKYVMHGFLWVWHKSHHSVHHQALEKNDWFGVVFSLPSIGLFYYASLINYNPYLLAVALGILCYGVFYVVFHDIIVHQRIKWRPSKRSKYLQRMINAHYVHHSKHSKEDCEAFGFLYAPPKYEPRQFKMKETRQETQ